MNPPALALRQLRLLRGWTRAELAAAAGLGEEVVRQTEEQAGHRVPAEVVGALLRAFGVDEDEFLGERVITQAEDGPAVFLFSGAHEDFDLDDLAPLVAALTEGREHVGSGYGRTGMATRLDFVPATPDRGERHAPARHGYRLAQHFRDRLGLGNSPAPDLCELVETRLGVVVRVNELQSPRVAACAVLDKDRAGAAIVLDDSDAPREGNPVLARVYLAHEICHLLFDPTSAGQIRVSLDDSAIRGHGDLFEKRARAFAAELLLPEQGIVDFAAEHGPPIAEDESRARTFVANVCEHFGTSWDIAAYHLYNHGFYSRDIMDALLAAKGGGPKTRPWRTALPAAGTSMVEAARRKDGEPEVAAARAWSEAVRQHAAVLDRAGSRATNILAEVAEAGGGEDPLAAADIAVRYVDQLCWNEDHFTLEALLRRADPRKMPTSVTNALLTFTLPVRQQLSGARTELLCRAIDTFRRAGWSSAEIAHFEARVG